MNSEGKHFLQRKKREWARKSLGYYLKYQEHKDPTVLAEFVQSSPFAVNEEWFMKEIRRLKFLDEHDTINKIFAVKKGGRKTEHEHAARDLMIVSRVDKLSRMGTGKADAFSHVSSQNVGFTNKCHINEHQVKKIYYKTRRKGRETWVKDRGDHYEVAVHPAQVVFIDDGKEYSCFGLLEIKVPKDHEKLEGR
jgi:hypothetical protein